MELHNSMVGIGTKDKKLIRLVVSRSELDMKNIKDAYLKLYGETLEKSIKVSNTFSLVQNDLIAFFHII